MPNRVSLEQLRRNRHYVFILAFMVSAVVGPPDAISMAVVALSTYLLYELGLLLARITLKK